MSQASVAAVRRGVRLLDEFVPDWPKKINPEFLEMSNTDQCMLGQTFKDFGIGCHTLAEKAIKKHLGTAVRLENNDVQIDASYYGFDESYNTSFSDLEVTWINVLRSRQRKAAPKKKR